ncbi:MAG: hypothetical protein K6T75_04115 [Acetobacteraceae bacterium]|nr:hypothetical protein [Acetobacteraceae bacterium]
MIREAQVIQSCIAHCQASFSDIKSMASATQNPQARDELNKAVQSMDACIKQCQAALGKVQ